MIDKVHKLKFLKDVSQTYRNNTSKVNTFLAAPSKESHHGNKPALITTAAQGADLLAALTTYDYNLDTKTMISKGINMIDLESKHKMSPDDTRQGLTNTLEASAFMGNLAKISDRGEYIAEAKKIGDNNDLRLPFYYSSKSNDGIDGKPVMTFFVEGLEKLSQVMESKIAGIDTEIEKLSTELTDLTEKRKSAIDSANDVIKKINEVKTNTVSKM